MRRLPAILGSIALTIVGGCDGGGRLDDVSASPVAATATHRDPGHARVPGSGLHEPCARGPGAGRRRALVRRRAGRSRARLRQHRHGHRDQRVHRHLRTRPGRRRARPARHGLRPAVREQRARIPALHARQRPTSVGARRVHEPRRRSDARPGERVDPAHGRPAVRQPQRRTSRLRPGRHALHGARGRRLGRRPAGQCAEHAQSPRQAPEDRRLGRHGLRNPHGQPLGRQCAVHERRGRRGMPGDPRLRPAQPLAIQLRRLDGRTVGRRCRPERLGGSGPHRRGRQLWVAIPRGRALLQPAERLPDREQRRRARRSRRRIRPRPR